MNKSDCCGANVWVSSADEGTSHYVCSFCKEACDIEGVKSYWYKGNTKIAEVNPFRAVIAFIIYAMIFTGVGYVLGRWL